MRLTTTLLILFIAGCSVANTPQLYPNEHLEKVGSVQSEVDIKHCQALAEQYVKDPSRFGGAVKETAIGSTIGAGAGALTGAIVKGSVGRSLGAGAAVGAIYGILNDLRKGGDASPTYKAVVTKCMDKEGYEVIGWK